MPILESESLAEYQIGNVGFPSLIEFRSKMGFKFSRVDHFRAAWKMGYEQTSENERAIRSIEYRYWVNSHIFITCVLSLEPITGNSTKDENTNIGDHPSKVKIIQ